MGSKKESVPSSHIGIALAVIYLIWGSTYLAIRIADETLPPFLMASLRFVAAGLALYAVLRLRGVPRPSAIEWRSTAIVGAFLLLGGNGLVVWAERTVPSGLAALLVSMVPLWMAVAEWAWPGGSRPTGRSVAGLLIGFLGLVILVAPGLKGTDFHLSGGVVALLLASPSWAVGSVYARRARLPASPSMVTACEMICGGVALLALSLLRGEPAAVSWHDISARSWSALAYLTLAGSLAGFTAYVWLLKKTSISVASSYAYVNPVVAVLLGWLVLGESLAPSTMVGGTIIIVAVAILTTSSRSTA